ncbi:MAG TPA: hypothetical protein VEP90_08710 [Methylomirabilota bacterium]|nr:hypothetical protein [Methylomirabilota bacterium]
MWYLFLTIHLAISSIPIIIIIPFETQEACILAEHDYHVTGVQVQFVEHECWKHEIR